MVSITSSCCPVAGSKQYSAAIAFTLALFSHLINHVNIRLQAELEEGENPVPAFQSDSPGKGGLLLASPLALLPLLAGSALAQQTPSLAVVKARLDAAWSILPYL